MSSWRTDHFIHSRFFLKYFFMFFPFPVNSFAKYVHIERSAQRMIVCSLSMKSAPKVLAHLIYLHMNIEKFLAAYNPTLSWYIGGQKLLSQIFTPSNQSNFFSAWNQWRYWFTRWKPDWDGYEYQIESKTFNVYFVPDFSKRFEAGRSIQKLLGLLPFIMAAPSTVQSA